MQFSVIICTYNRIHNLHKCISCLSRQEGADGMDWEALIVDNNSTDGTAEEVKKLNSQFPISIRYALEKEQGLNHARNRGIKESQGKYFAFIDDDILVSPSWLSAMYSSLVEYDADAVGGRIHLDKSLNIPSWIRPDMYGFLGHRDFGDIPFQMDGVTQYPFGGNMAFHRRVIDKIGFFNPDLGRKGKGQKRNELFKGTETDYFHRLASSGCRIMYQPASVVYHQVLNFQFTKKYFLTIHYNAGYQKAFNDEAFYQRKLIGIPLFLFQQFARSLKKYFIELIAKGIDGAFRQKMTSGYMLGMMTGYAKRKRIQAQMSCRNASGGTSDNDCS